MKPFEEFIYRAKGAVDAIGGKAGHFVDSYKLNMKLIDAKGELKSELEELGKIVYENYDVDEKIELKPEIISQIKTVKEMYEQVEKLKLQVAFMKNRILCKSCGHNNEVGALYCTKCGENLKKEGTPIEEETEKNDDFEEFDD